MIGTGVEPRPTIREAIFKPALIADQRLGLIWDCRSGHGQTVDQLRVVATGFHTAIDPGIDKKAAVWAVFELRLAGPQRLATLVMVGLARIRADDDRRSDLNLAGTGGRPIPWEKS